MILFYLLVSFLIILILLTVSLVVWKIGGYKSTPEEGEWTIQYATDTGGPAVSTRDTSHKASLSCDGRPWVKTKEESCDGLCDMEDDEIVVFFDDHDGIIQSLNNGGVRECKYRPSWYDPLKCNPLYVDSWKKYHANTSSLAEKCPDDVESYPAYGGCYLTGKRDTGMTAEKKANDYISRNKLKCYS